MQNNLIVGSTRLVFIALAAFSSCSKHHDDPVAEKDTTGMITAMIDDKSFTSYKASATFVDGNLSISGNGNSVGVLIINLENHVNVGTFDAVGHDAFTQTDADMSWETNNGAHWTAAAENGLEQGSVSLTEIDSINKTVSGNFRGSLSAPGKSDVQIKNGIFDKIPYTKTTNNTFTATVGEDVLLVNSISAYKFKDNNNFLSLFANNTGNQPGVVIEINYASSSPGTYSISPIPIPGRLDSLDDCEAQYAVSNDIVYVTSSGTLTIEHHDKSKHTIGGTFNFTGTTSPDNQSLVTAGAFNVEYGVE